MKLLENQRLNYLSVLTENWRNAGASRLRAQYYRIDPETRISDKAWGQKLFQRASLSRRERLDCYYAAGACFESLKIKNALRVRCGKIHEDEKRGPAREPRYESTHTKGSSHFKKKVFVNRKINNTHVADQEIEAEGEEERDGGSEEEPEDRQESEEGAEDEEIEGNSEGEINEEELKEVFAAGWKAKQKTSEVRKSRGWRPAAKSGGDLAAAKFQFHLLVIALHAAGQWQ